MSSGEDDVSKMLWRAARSGTVCVAQPELIEQLLKEGDKNVSEVKHVPVEEGLKAIFAQRLLAAQRIVDKLLPCPIYEPPLVELYDDIRLSIIFGMNGNAINLCGVLLEFILKYVRFLRDHGRDVTFNNLAWSKYIESSTLHNAIELARSDGFIDDEIRDRLISFKEDVRNPYAHFNIQKITEYAVFGNTVVKDYATGQERVEDVPASLSPTFQLLAKRKFDELQVIKVFDFVDSVVQHVIVKLREISPSEKV